MEQTVDGEIKGIIFFAFQYGLQRSFTDCYGVLRSLLLPVRDSIIFFMSYPPYHSIRRMSSDMANPGRIIISVGLLK